MIATRLTLVKSHNRSCRSMGQRDHHRRRRAMQGFPLLPPPLKGAFEPTPVLIRLLLLQELQQRGGGQGWMALKQRQQQRVPDLGQWVGTLPATGLGGFGLKAACINPVGIAHRDANRCGSHLLAATGSSFGHVERNLLNGEGIRHDPVPCAWPPDSADPSGAVNQIGAPSQTYCCGTIGNPPECVPCHVDSNKVQLLTRTRQTSSLASRYNRDSLLGCIRSSLH